MSTLTLADLIVGLERFSGKYEALDVYAADVDELQRARAEGRFVPADWAPFDTNQYVLPATHGAYVAELKPELGVLRLRRAGQSSTEPVLGAVAGAGLAAILFSKKPETVLAGAILGMLVARALAPDSQARQVFTMRFSPAERQWRAYSGSLIPTMKESLGLTPA